MEGTECQPELPRKFKWLRVTNASVPSSVSRLSQTFVRLITNRTCRITTSLASLLVLRLPRPAPSLPSAIRPKRPSYAHIDPSSPLVPDLLLFFFSILVGIMAQQGTGAGPGPGIYSATYSGVSSLSFFLPRLLSHCRSLAFSVLQLVFLSRFPLSISVVFSLSSSSHFTPLARSLVLWLVSSCSGSFPVLSLAQFRVPLVVFPFSALVAFSLLLRSSSCPLPAHRHPFWLFLSCSTLPNFLISCTYPHSLYLALFHAFVAPFLVPCLSRLCSPSHGSVPVLVFQTCGSFPRSAL
jgi:hypothetical protein